MAQHNETGKEGEEMAAAFLRKIGYEIVETNWRFKKSEIDIIVRKEDFLVFVEVKTRETSFFQDPEKAVTIAKQKMIIKGANEYVQNLDKKDDPEVRFDIIAITLRPLEINHIEEAFYPLV